MFKEISIPILYKYRPATPIDQLYRLIGSGELWFSSAKSFNDPFDTAITYDFEGLYTELAERWSLVAADRHMPELSEESKKEYAQERLRQMREDSEFLQRTQQELIEYNYESFGICSLASSKNDLLMWGHYARNHTGLCIGLDVSLLWIVAKQLVSKGFVVDLAEVTYSYAKPKINFFETNLKNDSEHVMQFVSTKSTHWSYEKEYRLVCFNHPNTALVFGADVIKEIIFGCKMPQDERDALLEYARIHNPNLSFYQSVMDEHEFKVNLLPIK